MYPKGGIIIGKKYQKNINTTTPGRILIFYFRATSIILVTKCNPCVVLLLVKEKKGKKYTKTNHHTGEDYVRAATVILHNIIQPQWNTTTMEDDHLGEQPQWKTRSMEDNLK